MPDSPTTTTRRVEVDAVRLAGWLERFATSHGPCVTTHDDTTVTVVAADGARAVMTVTFPPLAPGAVDQDSEPDAGLAAHTLMTRRVGVLLVRLGGYAVGIVDGGRLVESKVGSRQVHGRSAAGGWSQQRFARRREGQVRVALGAAADVAARILVPIAGSLDAIVLGGDRRSAEAVVDDSRLVVLRALVVPRVLDVPDPRKIVLDTVPARLIAVPVLVTDP